MHTCLGARNYFGGSRDGSAGFEDPLEGIPGATNSPEGPSTPDLKTLVP